MQSTEVNKFKLVPRAGVEPARPFGQRILSPQRLPFRHPGVPGEARVLQHCAFGYLSRNPSRDVGTSAIPGTLEF